MRLSTKSMPVQVETVDQLELLQLQEGMSSAYEALLDSQKNLDEVQEVMENITDSVNLITKFGQAGVEQLNVGGDLEELLQIPAKLITAEKAQEGLGEAAKSAWDKFIAFIKEIWLKIRNFFATILPGRIEQIKLKWKNTFAKLSGSVSTEAFDIKLSETAKLLTTLQGHVTEMSFVYQDLYGTRNSLVALYNKAVHVKDVSELDGIARETQIVTSSKDSKLVKATDRLDKIVEELEKMVSGESSEFNVNIDVTPDTSTVTQWNAMCGKLMNGMTELNKNCDKLATEMINGADDLSKVQDLGNFGGALIAGLRGVSKEAQRVCRCESMIFACILQFLYVLDHKQNHSS